MDGKFDKAATQAAMMSTLCKYYHDGLFTDVIVSCGQSGTQIKAHKNILCAASKWFTAAYAGGYKEAREEITILLDDTEQAVAAMLQFCYLSEYDDPAQSPIVFHVEMFAMGEKYMIPALQSFALSRLKCSVAFAWNIRDFTNATRSAYDDTVDPYRLLKTAVVELSIEHEADLFGGDDVFFTTMAAELPMYAFDICREIGRRNKRKREEGSADKLPGRNEKKVQKRLRAVPA